MRTFAFALLPDGRDADAEFVSVVEVDGAGGCVVGIADIVAGELTSIAGARLRLIDEDVAVALVDGPATIKT